VTLVELAMGGRGGSDPRQRDDGTTFAKTFASYAARPQTAGGAWPAEAVAGRLAAVGATALAAAAVRSSCAGSDLAGLSRAAVAARLGAARLQAAEWLALRPFTWLPLPPAAEALLARGGGRPRPPPVRRRPRRSA
jgi:hypothetical protein